MNEIFLYEYATIRFVPDVEREEFINVGLIMMCKRRGWLRAEINVPESRVDTFASAVDPIALRRQLHALQRVAAGVAGAGPIAALPAHERFRWLTAVRSACIQTSRPHPGHTTNLDATFTRLLRKLVL